MKRLSFIVVFVITLFNVCCSQTSQWDFYNLIPSFKKIEFVFDNDDFGAVSRIEGWEQVDQYETGRPYLVIRDNYSVSLTYLAPVKMTSRIDAYSQITISGQGYLLWKDDKMMLQLNITEKAPGFSWVQNFQKSAGYDLLGFEKYHPYHRNFVMPNHEKSYNISYEFYYDEQNKTFILLGNNICATIIGNMEGVDEKTYESRNQSIIYNAYINLNNAFLFNFDVKSESELNAENSDIYGKWQWNDDRSVIFLSSMTGEGSLVLWNNKDKLSWGFQMDNASSGYKTETTETGDELNYMMISFDGASEQSFAFDTKSDSTNRINFEYVQYDRFSGKLKRNASILGQIKDKRIMVVNYKLNGLDKTAMFQLEGLEAIYNALTEEDE